MRRWLKVLLWLLGGLIALVAALVLAAIIAIQTPWFHNLVRARIVSEIEKATGGRAELREFSFSGRTLTASVGGLVLHGTEGPNEPPLFRAERIAVGLKIISIWKKQIDLASVRVDRPQVNVIVYPDGHTNVPRPKAAQTARKKSAVQTVLDLAIKRFQIVDGTVQFSVRRMPLNIVGEDLRAQIFYEPAPARYRAGIGFRSLNVTSGQRAALPLNVTAQLTLFGNRVEVERVHLAASNSSVELKGAVEDFAAPRVNLRYVASLALKDLAAGPMVGPLESRGRINMTGQLSGESLAGRMEASGLAFRSGGIYIQNIRLVSGISYRGRRLDFRDLALSAAGGSFDGAATITDFRDFQVEGTARGFSLQEMTLVPGVRRVEWDGSVSGPVRITGAVAEGRLASFLLRTELAIVPAPGPNPVSGSVAFTYDPNRGTLSFGPSNLVTSFSRIQFSGVLGRKMDAAVETTNLDDAQPAIAMFTTGPPPAMPVKIEAGGVGRFQGSIVGPLKTPTIEGHASLTRFTWTGRTFDRGEADVVVSRSGVVGQNVVADQGGVHATGVVRVSLVDWRDGPNEPIGGSFDVRAPSLAEVLAAANERNPLEATSGPLAAKVTLGGTLGAIQVSGQADVTKVVFYGQPIERLTGSARYTEDQLDIPSAQLQINGSALQLSGRFEHPRGDWQVGRVRFQASTRGLPLAQLAPLRERAGGLGGRLEMEMAGEGELAAAGFRPGAFNGWVGLRDLAADGEPLGALLISAATKAGVVEARVEGDLAGAKVTGTSEWTLSGKYPVRGHVGFTPLQFSTLLTRLRGRGAAASPFNGVVAGAIDFSGSTLDPQSWRGTLELPVVELRPTDVPELATAQALSLRNTGPVLIDFDAKSARVRQAQFRARDTNLRLAGRVGFGSGNPWDLRVQGGVNLALLRDLDSSILSSGALALDVSIRGALNRPDVYGRIDLHNASLNYGTFPNGLDNANGVIFLYRDRAMIDTLTAESGGGKLSIGGFVAFTTLTTFNLQAKASDVRVRYPEGVSSTVNATLSLTGTIDRSVLSGDVTVTRVGFNPRSDLGSILASASQPVAAPSRPSRFEQGLRFDVRMVTSPQVRFETQLTKDVRGDASLRLRGDRTRPALLGRVSINSGEVIFFGNRYTITSGQILFVNASKIEPTLDLDLETRVQGIDVTLHLSGPIGRMNVSYRSDPPLPFADIVALLATGRAPTYGAQVGPLGGQSGQGWEQAGASALVSQAIASPITGRLQRFFGVSRLKIDPLVTGLTTSNAAARITLEQNITSNLTFTYITDLSRAQAQIIRVEWDFSNEWSAVAVREENGLFGIDFLWRKQLK